MRYRITHDTVYSYASAVTRANHLAHLAPRSSNAQKVDEFTLTITPQPAECTDHIDFFGNPFSILTIEEHHERFAIQAQSLVEVNRPEQGGFSQLKSWEQVRDEVRQKRRTDVLQYQCYSLHTRPTAAIRDYARRSFPAGRPLLAGVRELTARIHDEFDYDPGTTDISTPVEKVFEIKSGVCQDFSHLQLAALRSLGIACRYVSGYLRTYPPKGQPRLVGADASHAWVSVYDPELGWVDFDPTNNSLVKNEHITLGWGRDFNDVSPVSGVILGGGRHFVNVSVDVMPL